MKRFLFIAAGFVAGGAVVLTVMLVGRAGHSHPTGLSNPSAAADNAAKNKAYLKAHVNATTTGPEFTYTQPSEVGTPMYEAGLSAAKNLTRDYPSATPLAIVTYCNQMLSQVDPGTQIADAQTAWDMGCAVGAGA